MARNSLHKIVSVVLCISFIIGISCFFTASAAESQGTISADKVNVRTGAGTDKSILQDSNKNNIQLSSGHKVTVLETVKSTTDTTYVNWYKIKFTYSSKEYTGYVYTGYVTITPTEHDFTMPEGVPNEYKSYIENILKYYPNWKFVFYDTGLDWNSLFGTNAQGYVGRSLIPSSSPLSYRSTASGCYNWRSDEWIMQDAGGWYQANTQTIAYYMDPRNFLNINDVFMFESLSYDKTTQTLDGVEKILENSFMDNVKIKDTNGKSLTY
ncbi:MAG: SH3 domain-containing protein, partial [Oscillospiraceae bacterium]|nr:SH3 domain-containing protein [Oscillospiraceae bacterium]